MANPGILPRQEIIRLCKERQLIEPTTEPSFQAASYDLTVGTVFRKGEILHANNEVGDKCVVLPGEVITLLTAETLNIPDDLAAYVSPINKQSEQGFLVLNPGHIDPGYRGQLSVKAINLRKTSLRVAPGDPIFTIVFERLSEPTDKPYDSHGTPEDREKSLAQKDLDTGVPNLAELLLSPENSPFVLRRDLDTRLASHWTTKLTTWCVFGGTAVAAVSFVVAAVACVYTFAGIQASYSQTLAAIKGMQSPPAPSPTGTNASGTGSSGPSGQTQPATDSTEGKPRAVKGPGKKGVTAPAPKGHLEGQ